MLDVDDSSFVSTVMGAAGAVLVDFWAPWCAPCKALTPVLEELSREPDFKNVLFVKVNVDNARVTAGQFSVQSIPLLVVLRRGVLIAQHVGVDSKMRIRQFLANALS